MPNIKTPHTHIGFTIAEMEATVGPSNLKVTVPAGTRCILLEPPGHRWVVDDLSFLDPSSIVHHDADHYGITVSERELRDIQPK